MRKERAQSDLQLKRERDRAESAESELSSLQAQLREAQAALAEERTRHEGEVNALKTQLARSLKRESDLQALRAEAHSLMILQGIQLM